MEEIKVIKRVTEHTDWCSSMTYAMKPDGTIRLCLDPSKLNKALRRCPHKTPTLEELTHKFKDAKYFTKLDAKSGYWAVKLDEASQALTTFRTPNGRYCFLRLPMGLSTSQDIFQAKMDDIIVQCEGVVGIADDIVVHGKTEQEHNENLHKFMQVAKQSGLVLNSKKTAVKQAEIKFFGVIITRDGMKPDPGKCEDIQKTPTPTSKHELSVFLGMIRYLSPFIKDLATRAGPIMALMKQQVPFEWDESHEHCFQTLKTEISSDAILTKAPVRVVTDASQRGLGAVLQQPDKGMPDTVGCIDCTHICIPMPYKVVGRPEVYICRKSYPSINVQAICGPNRRVWDVVAKWPGSVNDSRILRTSNIRAAFESGDMSGILLGDAGYGLKTWLMTPYPNPVTPEQEHYNKVHTRTRVRVEQAFGIAKRRFACLRRLRVNDPGKCCKIIAVCFMLHNICIDMSDILLDYPVVELEQDNPERVDRDNQAAEFVRDRIATVLHRN